MGDFEVTGGDDWLRLSKALKGWDNDMRKELHKSMETAGKELIPELREVIRDSYPKRGGLNDIEAKRPIKAKVRTGKDAGLHLIAYGITFKLVEGYGFFRHPVYAPKGKTRREWRWVDQRVSLQDAFERWARNSSTTRVVITRVQEAVEATAQKVVERVEGRR